MLISKGHLSSATDESELQGPERSVRYAPEVQVEVVMPKISYLALQKSVYLFAINRTLLSCMKQSDYDKDGSRGDCVAPSPKVNNPCRRSPAGLREPCEPSLSLFAESFRPFLRHINTTRHTRLHTTIASLLIARHVSENGTDSHVFLSKFFDGLKATFNSGTTAFQRHYLGQTRNTGSIYFECFEDTDSKGVPRYFRHIKF